MRGFASGLFILIGALLTFPAAIAIWEQRVLTDRDAFIEVGQDVLAVDAVQDRLTEEITSEIEDVAAANGIDLPTTGIAGALAAGQAEALTRTVVAQLPDSVLGEQVLSLTHAALLAVIDNENDRLEASNDEVRVNLRPAIEQVILAFEPIIPELGDIELPPDTGEIVIIQEEDVSLAFQAARWFDGAAWYIALVPVAFYALALLIASNRQMALALTGISLVVAAGGRILLYEGPFRRLTIDGVAESRAEAAPATAGVYDTVIDSLISQEMLLVAAGAGIVVLSTVWWGLKRISG